MMLSSVWTVLYATCAPARLRSSWTVRTLARPCAHKILRISSSRSVTNCPFLMVWETLRRAEVKLMRLRYQGKDAVATPKGVGFDRKFLETLVQPGSPAVSKGTRRKITQVIFSLANH